MSYAPSGPDGFAGFEPESRDRRATVITNPVAGHFAALQITADVREGGFVSVAVLDDAGTELAVSEPVSETVTRRRLTWKKGWDEGAKVISRMNS